MAFMFNDNSNPNKTPGYIADQQQLNKIKPPSPAPIWPTAEQLMNQAEFEHTKKQAENYNFIGNGPNVMHTAPGVWGAPAKNANAKQIAGQHYKHFKYQPWDVVMDWDLGYLDGTALKYIARWKDKNGVEDIKKAIHFLEKLVEVQEGKNGY